MLIDSHCHIHDKNYPLLPDEVIKRANLAGVEKMICIGTDVESSTRAVEFANRYPDIYATVGVHPHESKNGHDTLVELLKNKNSKLVGIGEIGLDYYYDHSPKNIQAKILAEQIQLAIDYGLPISFHVREAYDDFWPIFDSFSSYKIKSVLHSFTDSKENLEKALVREMCIGVNGFCTFIKDQSINEMFKSVPIDKILLETDAPYLTPKPFRGTINEPAYIKNIAEFIAESRGLDFELVSKITTQNVCDLFKI